MTATEDLITPLIPLVKYLAKRIARRLPPSVPEDELVQWGSMGLMDAAKKYDPARDNKFQTYAEYRIRGAILDGLRGLDLMGRTARDLEKMIERVRLEFERDNKRAALTSDLEEKLKMSVAEFHTASNLTKQIVNIPIEKWDFFTPDDRKALLTRTKKKSEDPASKIEAIETVERILAHAGPIDRACFILYYVWGFLLTEIAELFNVTESRISQRINQIHARHGEKR